MAYIKSRYVSTCTDCQKHIPKNQSIYYDKTTKTVLCRICDDKRLINRTSTVSDIVISDSGMERALGIEE